MKDRPAEIVIVDGVARWSSPATRCARKGCKARLLQPVVGRPVTYCSARCRQAAWARRRRQSPLLSSRSVQWYTPLELWRAWQATWGPFELDPAADPRAPLWSAIPRHWTVDDDGLAQPWSGRVWCNPPYGRALADWIRKAVAEWARGACTVIVLLVPARTDTRWWTSAIAAGAVAHFLQGRIRFALPGGATASSAPFPSALLVFGGA